MKLPHGQRTPASRRLVIENTDTSLLSLILHTHKHDGMQPVSLALVVGPNLGGWLCRLCRPALLVQPCCLHRLVIVFVVVLLVIVVVHIVVVIQGAPVLPAWHPPQTELPVQSLPIQFRPSPRQQHQLMGVAANAML